MADTKIEWTDKTWNPTRGCGIVSPGCKHCYAMRQAHRFSGPGGPYEGLTVLGSGGPEWTGEVRLIPEKLDEPLGWRKGVRIFVNSQSDLFHGVLSNADIADVFGVMVACPHHTFQILTKRAGRLPDWFEWAAGFRSVAPCWWRQMVGHAAQTAGSDRLRRAARSAALPPWPLPNVWIGVSVESQTFAEKRIPRLLETPAAVRFLSCEPLLGPLDLTPWLSRLDWVIAGGESGPGARPMHPDWVRSIRDQCAIAGVPFHFKQWGEFRPHGGGGPKAVQFGDGVSVAKLGKKEAGRTLDGREWDQFPA